MHSDNRNSNLEISVIWNKSMLAYEIAIFCGAKMISNSVYKNTPSDVRAQVEKWQVRYSARAIYGNLAALLLK